MQALKRISDDLLAAQLPVLSWWAMVVVASRAAATLTVLAIFLYGAYLHSEGLVTVGEIVTFINFATMLIGRLEQAVGFVNFLFANRRGCGSFTPRSTRGPRSTIVRTPSIRKLTAPSPSST